MNFIDNIDEILKPYPKYRSSQVYNAIFKNLKTNWASVSTIPKDLALELMEQAPLDIKAKLFNSNSGDTIKAVIELDDGNLIETVLMKFKGRNTVCVSTQVGCPMACLFCESGRNGFTRNLSVGEMASQVLFFNRILAKENEKITNIVYMGMGEPFLNYENVLDSIRLLADEKTQGISQRKFSISTSGVVPGINKLAKERELHPNLAISLHAATDEKREMIMPINKQYPLRALGEAVGEYFKKTKRKVMFEYILIAGFNMTEGDARELKKFLGTMKVSYVVNLIPLNKTTANLVPPTAEELQRFKGYLEKFNVDFVQRYSFGQDISAACGQLVKNISSPEARKTRKPGGSR